LKWFGSHRTLPVGLIAKNSSEITDYINESKNEPTRRPECKVAVFMVAFRGLPTGYEIVDGLGVTKGIFRVIEGMKTSTTNIKIRTKIRAVLK
jgi:hypothetical protein